MRVAITGSSGMVGSEVVAALGAGGHEAVRMVRGAAGVGEISWSPAEGVDPAAMEGIDAVVHLAGESIASGRWTAARKKRIRDSRVEGTKSLVGSLARMATPPRVLVSASAIGFYGDRGTDLLREDSGPGSGFLARLCREWERAAEPAKEAGIRTVVLRFGMILSPKGGALAKMLLPFRLGLGGKVGSGAQYMSWITIDDAVRTILHTLKTESLAGPLNTVAPSPVTNQEFTKTLGRVLSRPTVLPMPALMALIVFGEMGEELLLGSARVDPGRLQGAGYSFRHPELEGALRHLLGGRD